MFDIFKANYAEAVVAVEAPSCVGLDVGPFAWRLGRRERWPSSDHLDDVGCSGHACSPALVDDLVATLHVAA